MAPVMTSEQSLEAGVGAHGEFGQDTMGVGSDLWLEANLLGAGSYEGWGAVQLVARGSATSLFPYSGAGAPLGDVLAEGTAGVRASYAVTPTFYLGGEILGGYEQRTGIKGEQTIVASLGMPVAEQATPDIWVYADPTIGLLARLDGDPCSHGIPFCGYTEVPLGVAWRINPMVMVMAEGGLSLPVQPGGYGALALSLRF
ncbi:MAG TPA: hypothetical protein VGO62_20740 [Myxococcota bacterium]|jgi:hypothetical protein